MKRIVVILVSFLVAPTSAIASPASPFRDVLHTPAADVFTYECGIGDAGFVDCELVQICTPRKRGPIDCHSAPGRGHSSGVRRIRH